MNLKKFNRYLKLEVTSGLFLFFTTVCALLIANSPYVGNYENLFNTPLGFNLNGYQFEGSLHFWINDGLMSLFFLLIGLELKRELLIGELREFTKIMLPAIAALGGMIIPAIIYIALNKHNSVLLRGWSIPVATDIAFALGILSLLNKKVPIGLKLFLMSLAIFDDIGAIIIIAIFYTDHLSFYYLGFCAIVLCILWVGQYRLITRLSFYWILGILLWFFILKSGIHATISGVLLAAMIPLKKKPQERYPPLHRLEELLHPWVAYFIVPIFAFVNAGLSFHEVTWDRFTNSIVLGIMGGLFLGKQLGVFIFVWLMKQLNLAKLPDKTTWLQLYGVALLCGIGFTMSLFLGTLAFETVQPSYLTDVRLGVFIGSFLSGLMGVIVLQFAFKAKRKGDFVDK